MTTRLRILLLTGIAGGLAILTSCPAYALNGPSTIEIDGGPLGPLEISGGAAGYFFAQTGTSDDESSILGDRSTGAALTAALIDLQKSSGILQFNIEVGPEGGSPNSGHHAAHRKHHPVPGEPDLSGLCHAGPSELADHHFRWSIPLTGGV